MPTAYTDCIKDDATFEQFVWRCARAMGALIDMRDEPLDAPIPERFEPSDFYLDRLERARAELNAVALMTPAECERAAADEYERVAGSVTESQIRDEVLALKYQSMIDRVTAWEPPTPEHEGFRKFMLDQLNESLKWDCGHTSDRAPERLAGPEWQARRMAALERDIEYCERHHREEVERVEARNRWIAELRASVPPQAENVR